MTGTNHAVTGAVIGMMVVTPLALPIAVASHVILDMLPHYGDKTVTYSSKRFRRFIRADTCLCISLFVLLMMIRPAHWPLMVGAGLLAMSPDLMWLPNYFRIVRGKQAKPYNALMRWHEGIQRERPWAWKVEAVWFAIFGSIFVVHGLSR